MANAISLLRFVTLFSVKMCDTFCCDNVWHFFSVTVYDNFFLWRCVTPIFFWMNFSCFLVELFRKKNCWIIYNFFFALFLFWYFSESWICFSSDVRVGGAQSFLLNNKPERKEKFELNEKEAKFKKRETLVFIQNFAYGKAKLPHPIYTYAFACFVYGSTYHGCSVQTKIFENTIKCVKFMLL